MVSLEFYSFVFYSSTACEFFLKITRQFFEIFPSSLDSLNYGNGFVVRSLLRCHLYILLRLDLFAVTDFLG